MTTTLNNDTQLELFEVETPRVVEYVGVYKAAGLVNEALAKEGVKNDKGKQKAIPPQMMYNYTTARIREGKSPLIASIVNEVGKTLINKDAFDEWLARYIKKQVALAGIV